MTAKTKGIARHSVSGVVAPTVRLTPLGAALVALCVAIPAGAVIGLIDWLS